MKKVLIFEGPDNVGKSTQIKKVRKFFKNTPFVVSNLEAPAGETNQEKLKYGLENIEKYFELVEAGVKKDIALICDRFHFSEYAYSFLRGGHEIDGILDLEKKYDFLKNEIIIFTFVDKVENIISRDDGLSAFDPEKRGEVQKIVDNFKEISEKSIFENYLINIDGKDKDEVFEIILEKIKNKFNL